MSERDSSTLRASTTNLRESNSNVREAQYRETSQSRAESHADGLRQESSTTTHTETYGDAVSNAISTSKTYERIDHSEELRNPAVVITSYNGDSSISPSLNNRENDVKTPSL